MEQMEKMIREQDKAILREQLIADGDERYLVV